MHIALNIIYWDIFILYIHINTHNVLKASRFESFPSQSTGEKPPCFGNGENSHRSLKETPLPPWPVSTDRAIEEVLPRHQGLVVQTRGNHSPAKRSIPGTALAWRNPGGLTKQPCLLAPIWGGWHGSCIEQCKGSGEIISVSCSISSFYIFLHKPVQNLLALSSSIRSIGKHTDFQQHSLSSLSCQFSGKTARMRFANFYGILAQIIFNYLIQITFIITISGKCYLLRFPCVASSGNIINSFCSYTNM